MTNWNGKGTGLAGLVSAGALAMLLLAACGNQGDSTPAATASVLEAGDDDGDSFGICRMLTAEQVSSVLPGHDGGSVTSAGGSLIEGVDSYQCSYTAVHGTDMDLLTVIVTVAPDDALFEQIKVSGFAFDDDDAVAVGDSGWKKDDSADQFEVVANKGRSVLRIDLMTSDAQSKSGQTLALAQAVAAKL